MASSSDKHYFFNEKVAVIQVRSVTAFLSNRVCQDPLENFFGRQWQRGRANESPIVAKFLQNTQALRIVSKNCYYIVILVTHQ